MKAIILEEAYRTIQVNDGDKQIKVPMAQAIVRARCGQRRQRASSAHSGSSPSLLSATERENKALNDEWLDVAITYKVEWDQELERAPALGITDLPDPLPHPDHVVIDMSTGTAYVRGPSTKEEKTLWDAIQGRRQEFEEELRDLEAIASDPNSPHQDIVRQDIEHTRKILAIINAAESRWGKRDRK